MKRTGSEAGFDRLVREALRRPRPAAEPCPPPADLAAFLEGAITADEQVALERHLAACERCQATLARAATTAPATEPVRSRPWLPAVPLRWLLPTAAVGAAAIVTYLVVASTMTARPPAVGTLKVAERAAGARSEEAATERAPVAPAPNAPPAAAALPAPAPAGGAGFSGAERKKDEAVVPRLADRETGFPPGQAGKPGPTGVDRAREGSAARPAAVGGVVGGAVGGIVPNAAPSPANAADARGNVANVAPAAPVAGYENQQAVMKGQAPGPAQAQAAADRAQAPAEAAQRAQAPPAASPQAASQVYAQAPPREVQAPVSRQAPPARQGAGAASGTAAAVPADASRAPRPGGLAKSLVVTGAVTFASPGRSVWWRIDPSGVLFRSRDAGATWQELRMGGGRFLAGSAPSDDVCWVAGRHGAVAVTADGEHWVHPAFPEDTDLVRVEARDAGRAAVTTRDGRRFETGDGGASWLMVR